MAVAKKFGAFTGVFTPSVLTILGVIMYLRLPWIVGQGGIATTIGIVVVAHIISVTTGLSVSSIATDKRVKAGGTYYMISRSLGLPIGGTLGLALFVGLSFSVSLYVIGFSESFLGFWDFEVSKNTIRLAGSITLISVTTVTLISTALALKTQFYILTAIGLSLLSIVLGRHDLGPDAVVVATSTATAVPFIVLFGIFFPAVTGFEAGVSMSGDLRDPKKSIPVGTISAILVGLVVYIALANFLGRTVSADVLRNNSTVLLDIALVPGLVVAGIWGATISSAFGSILGAPRILQATAVDGIMPRFLAHGHGKENEPRRAMLLTFVIAEVGILIGELDVIARVVSMFFITTYGFLNLTAAIESWVSPDFRPDFRVPKVVPIIGSIACFVVMIQLDFLAMIGSTIVLGSVYLFLARRQLTLESGDTWEGVWSSVARGALRRLAGTVQHRRNWRPNILQFGDVDREPDLTEFGATLIEHRGLMTNVQVVPTETDITRRDKPAPEQTKTDRQIFHRTVEAPDEYQGIATVAALYGFSGIDPNTVLLGWPDDAGTDTKYGALVSRLAGMDHNLLLLRTGTEGFGNREHVDVWWSGYSRNIGLAIALVKFLTTSDDWPLTQVRFFIVNNGDASLNEALAQSLRVMLDEHRVYATIRVVNNGLERRPFDEILAEESGQCDLTILGLPNQLASGSQPLKSQARLLEHTGTTLLIRASSFFPEVAVIPSVQRVRSESVDAVVEPVPEAPALVASKTTDLATPVQLIDDDLQDIANELRNRILNPTLVEYQQLLDILQEAIETTFNNLDDAAADDDRRRRDRAVSRVHSAFLFRTEELFETFAEKELPLQHDRLGQLLAWHDKEWNRVREAIPHIVRVQKDGSRTKKRRVYFKRWFEVFVSEPAKVQLLDVMRTTERAARDTLVGLRTVFRNVDDSVARVETAHDKNEPIEDLIDLLRNEASTLLTTVRDELAGTMRNVATAYPIKVRENLNRFVRFLDGPKASRRRFWRRQKRSKSNYLADVDELCVSWSDNRKLEVNEVATTVQLSAFRNRLDTIVERATDQLMLEISNGFLDPIAATTRDIEDALEKSHALSGKKIVYEGKQRFESSELTDSLLGEIEEASQELPEEIELPPRSNLGDDDAQFEGPLPVREAVRFQVEMDFSAPLRDAIERAAPRFDGAANVALDVVQLARFYLDQTEETTDADVPDSGDAMVKSAIERLNEARRDIEEHRDTLAEFVDQRFRTISDGLHTVALRRTASLLGRHEREKRGRAALARFSALFSRTAIAVRRRIVRLQYRQSEGILLARRLGLSGQRTLDDVARLRQFVDEVSPTAIVVAELPPYYRQLFLGQPAVVPVGHAAGRSKERAEAALLVTRHAAGASGAIAILGPPRSGRTTVVRTLTNRTLNRAQVYHVYSPAGGSCDPKVFRRQLGKSLGRAGSIGMMMHGVPQGSVIFIHDLELWWERREGGDAVIEFFVDLLARYGSEHLFMVTASARTYKLINRLSELEQHVLGVIECRAFDAEDLKDAILTRHESTGLTYTLDDVPETELGDWKVANLFTDMFRYTQGNVGNAMHAWISHIERVSGKMLSVVEPSTPDVEAIDMLRPPQVALLIQLILHRQLSLERFVRITAMPEADLMHEISTLRRLGLIAHDPDLIQVNPFCEPHLINRFADARHL